MRNSCHAQKNALESLFQYHLNMILLKVGKFRKQIIIQGRPLGIDIMYLVLADGNTQVRFGLEVVWES